MKKLADISELRLKTEPKVEEEVILVVGGYLRDTAWILETEKIHFSLENFEVDINLQILHTYNNFSHFKF